MPKLVILIALAGCGGTEEATTVALPVGTSPDAIATATTDLGYEVQVMRLRIAMSTLQFTIEGEQHGEVASAVRPHPGHSAGGEVTGELPGDYVLVWNGRVQPALGTGTLIVGDYRGANFALRAATPADALAPDDRLLGHTFELAGIVARGGVIRPFEALLDVEPDTAVIGAVFEEVITEASTATLALVFDPSDRIEGDSAFDGVDFFTLPEHGGSLSIGPGSAAHNILRRTLQTHDHYAVVAP